MKAWISWLLVFLCILAIFLVAPTARAIQNFVTDNWGRSLFGYLVLTITLFAFLTLVSFLFFRLRIRSLSNYIWLSAVAALYFYFTLKLWELPEEAVHFLEYGLLGFFIFRALSLRIKDKSIYIIAILISSLVGIFDEILQWMIPLRYWDIRDVGLNALSGTLFQVAIWKGIKPGIISKKLTTKSLRTVSVLLAVNITILGLCMSNTPQRVARYTRFIPALSFLQKEESMTEFRFKHRDPEIGVFYSSLTLEELEKTDNKNAHSYARILEHWKNKKYNKFLRDFNLSTNPFLHELRVHVFRRNQKYRVGLGALDEESKKKVFFIAYKENLILEKYFGQTIRKSVYQWEEEKTQEIEALIDRNQPYTSPVSYGLFTSVDEKEMWVSILVFLAGLAILNVWLSRKNK